LIKQGFESGEVSKPDLDKALIYNINVQAEWQNVVSGILIQKEQIKQLNGGIMFEDSGFEYPSVLELLPDDSLFAQLPTQNPELVMAQLEIEHSELKIKHEKINQLPSIEAGYRSEKMLSQKLQGIHAGIEIPLWQNKNQVKHARIQSEWSIANLKEQESKIRSELISKYKEILNLQNIYSQMKAVIQDETISESSLQLLQSGQISFREYLLETQFIWDVKKQYLETERNYHIAVSGLKQILNMN
jgi:outer membrane protein, heavy metal efflux system